MTMTAPPPTNNFSAYRAVCAEAAAQPPSAWTFKRDGRYTRILEHVTQEQGAEFLTAAREEFPHLWDQAVSVVQRMAPLNDDLGKPWRMWFPEIELECSPSNLRYLYHALRVWKQAEACGIRQLRIVELGGGYGGLALYLHALRPFFTPQLDALDGYVIVDVPEACLLQRAYTKALGMYPTIVDGLDADQIAATLPRGVASHFFVSCFAFSEFDAETQAWYREKLVRHCPHGFVVWNFMVPLVGVAEKTLGGPLYPFVDAPLTVEDERPLTGAGNKVVTW